MGTHLQKAYDDAEELRNKVIAVLEHKTLDENAAFELIDAHYQTLIHSREIEARKPLERMLEKLDTEKCPVCEQFLIDDDLNICEACNYGVHEWCTGYTYDGDGEYPAESAYAICKTCYKPELKEQTEGEGV